jgi:Secretion system C-terminal sorting domain
VDFIEVILKTIQPNFADLQLTVVPNPVIEEAIITVNTTSHIGKLHLQLCDIVGKPIKALTTENTEFHLRRNDLPAGVYLFEITTDGLRVGSGKIIIQ